MHLLSWGNSYSHVVRRSGEVAELWPLPPNKITVKRNDRGNLEYWYNGGEQKFRQDQIFHIPLLGFNGLVGFSPLTMARRAIGLGLAAEEYASRFFENDARPGIVLRHPTNLSEKAEKNLVDSWQGQHGGVSKSWRVKVLEEGMDIEQVGIPPKDAQFLEVREFQERQIAKLFRIPPHLLSDTERSTSWGTGIEQQNIGLVTYTLRPYLVRIERAIKQQLILPRDRDRFFAEFLIDGLLRGDMQARKEFYATARQWGWMSANDILELENRNPIEGGDTYLQPMNMVPSGTNPIEEESNGQRMIDAEWRTALPPIQHRSASARRRLANAHQSIYRDVLRRLLRIERERVQKEINKSLRRRDVESFAQWVRDFYYGEFQDRIIEQMQPPIRSLTEAVSAEAADEVASDPPSEEQLDRFARDYAETFAKRHAGDSRARLLKRIEQYDERTAESRQDDDLADILEDDLAEWDDRVEIDSHDETHRTSNAAAKFAYGAAGVMSLRWLATGDDPCDFCQRMNGTIVGREDSFLSSGSTLDVGGNIFSSQSDIGHPPMHTGCECTIVPE